MRKLATVTLFALLASGCATQTYQIAPSMSQQITSDTPTDHEEMQTFFVSGIGQEKTFDAAAACGGKENVVAVQTKLTPLNWALGFVTQGIYTPRQIRAYCK